MKIIENIGYTKLEKPGNILGNRMEKPGKADVIQKTEVNCKNKICIYSTMQTKQITTFAL